MKKKLIEAIKAKFVGIDDNTAKRLAERTIAKSENGISTEDEIEVAVKAIELSDVLKSVSDFSGDEAVKRYEEKYGLEKGEKKDKSDKDEKDDKDKNPDKGGKSDKADKSEKDDDNAAAFKALLAELKDSMASKFDSLQNELTAIKSGKISETRKAKLDAVIKDLKDYQKKPYGRIDLGKMSDDEFDSFLTDVKEEVGDALAANKASDSHVSPLLGGGYRQNNGKGGGDTKEATKEELDALVDKFNLK